MAQVGGAVTVGQIHFFPAASFNDLQKAKWISVESELPKPYVPVIVARHYKKGEPLKVEQGLFSVNGWWKVYGTNTIWISGKTS